MARTCPICGGAVSKKNKRKGALCNSCTFAYKHAFGECPYKDLSPRAMMREDKVFCARCKQLMIPKAEKEPKPDVELAQRLGTGGD